MSRIHEIEVSNFKRIRSVALDIPAGVTCIGGQNGEGKSSLIDAVIVGLCGEKFSPPDPIRKGQKHADIRIVTDDYTIIVQYKSDGNRILEVLGKDGVKIKKPQSVLAQLYNGDAPDITAFLRMKPADQAQKLREMLGIDTSALDLRRKQLFETRTMINRDVKELEGAMKKLPVYADAPSEELSIADLMAEHKAARGVNQRAHDARNTANSLLGRVESAADKVRRLKSEYETAVLDYKDLKAKADQSVIEANVAEIAIEDLGPIEQKIDSVSAINQKVAANKEQAKAMARWASRKDESDQITREMEAIDLQKQAMLAKVKFPVPGLGISDESVTINGFPLVQASKAEQLVAAFHLYLALNPELKFVPIYDGSLFDDESLALLAEACETYDAQIIMERVGEGPECSFVIEEGAIKAA